MPKKKSVNARVKAQIQKAQPLKPCTFCALETPDRVKGAFGVLCGKCRAWLTEEFVSIMEAAIRAAMAEMVRAR